MNVIVVFNKLTDQYIGSTHGTEAMALHEHHCLDAHFKYKTVDMDPETQMWQGDFNTGGVILQSNQITVITETELDSDCQDKIFRKYRYYHQINTVFAVLDELISALPIDESVLSEYRNMRTYIDSTLSNNERYKSAYQAQSGYEYWDKTQERSVLNAQLEGGLHEVVGRASHPGVPQ